MLFPPHFEVVKAQRADVPAIVALLVDDELGKTRELYQPNFINENYYKAFDAISADNNNELVVLKNNDDGEIIGTLQLTFIANMTLEGGKRAQIEGVRIKASYRNKGLGKSLFEWAIAKANKEGCRLVQLTTNKQRPDAIRFYQQLGFVPSHIGFKLDLKQH